MKIRSMVKNKEKFIKRRQRLIGPNGMTLKALELLTGCYILVQGNTVSMMGYFKDIKVCRRIIEDTMHNVHPIYNIKELMIKRELAKNPAMKDASWDKFLPHFKKQNVKRKKLKRREKSDTPFPPEQKLRKIDEQMISGEYFLTKEQKDSIESEKKAKRQEQKLKEKISKREVQFEVPQEKSKNILETKAMPTYKKPDINELKNKFLGKRKRED